MLSAILSQKPAGIILSYKIFNGQDYQNLWLVRGTYSIIYNVYGTYQAIMDDVPGGVPFTFESVYNTATYQTIWNTEQTFQDLFDADLTY